MLVEVAGCSLFRVIHKTGPAFASWMHIMATYLLGW